MMLTRRWDKTRMPSRHVTAGPGRAPHRSYHYAMGLTEDEINQPFIGVATCWNEAAPCNIALSRQAQSVKKGVSETGGTPREFTTITVTDGIAMGHQGMKSSLVSRDLIADSVELTVRGHCYDALVGLAGCDKSLPGMTMAMLRLDEYALSAIAVPGRVRGPLPRRAMRTWSSSGMNCGQSPCWPGVRMLVTGRHRRSAARWILVLRPPRDRPSASRRARPGGFLSFRDAPCDQFGGQFVPGSGRVLVRADHGGIGAEGPVRAFGLVAPGPEPSGSSARSRPVTSGDAGYRRSSSARTPRAGHATGSRSGSGTRSRSPHAGDRTTGAPPRIGGHHRQQPLPFLIGQVMTIQPIIHPP